MSVTMTKTDGVSMLTLNSDPQSSCPPLCQILRGLCYNPLCCSVSQHLRRVQRTSQSALGALHIMVGLLSTGLGVILIRTVASLTGNWWWRILSTGHPFWLGALFILFGIVSILSEKYPSPCLVIVNVILNLAGIGFAITAIVFYSICILKKLPWLPCEFDSRSRYNIYLSPQEELMKEKCLEGSALVRILQRSITALLLVLSVLELCVVISSAVMGIKALRSSQKRENKSTDDPEHYKTLLEDVTSNPAV